MPLRVQCRFCGRILVLNDAFAGGRCRCQHCRTVTAVPSSHQSSPTSATSRPSRPPLIGEAPSHASPVQAASPRVAAARRPASPGLRRHVTFGRASAALGIAAILVGLPAWYFALSGSRQPTVHQTVTRVDTVALPEANAGLSGAPLALASADPLNTYFGLPLSGSIIGYVVDGDSAMTPYIHEIASLTDAVNASFVPGSKRYGIAQTYGEGGEAVVEVAEPVGDLEGSRLTISPRTSAGRTNLSDALGVTSGWYADQVFLVMAKTVDAEELQKLAATAEQSGAIVNVIALGEAARQPELAEIAAASRGKFVPVSDTALRDLLARQRAAQEDRNRVAAAQ